MHSEKITSAQPSDEENQLGGISLEDVSRLIAAEGGVDEIIDKYLPSTSTVPKLFDIQKRATKAYSKSFLAWVMRNPDYAISVLLEPATTLNLLNRIREKYSQISFYWVDNEDMMTVTKLDNIMKILQENGMQTFPSMLQANQSVNGVFHFLFTPQRAVLLQAVPAVAWKHYLQNPKTRTARTQAIQKQASVNPAIREIALMVQMELVPLLTLTSQKPCNLFQAALYPQVPPIPSHSDQISDTPLASAGNSERMNQADTIFHGRRSTKIEYLMSQSMPAELASQILELEALTQQSMPPQQASFVPAISFLTVNTQNDQDDVLRRGEATQAMNSNRP